jgi:4-hydroxy-2-oxoglutarate aldolase
MPEAVRRFRHFVLYDSLMKMTFAAVFPPMATPFQDGDVNVPAIASNIEKWVRAGVGGVVALGSNGEAPLLDDDEGDRVLGAAREALPSTHILIAGTGRESTRATIAASRRAASLGASAVLVRTPSYFKARMTSDALVAHYTAVADACPVPLLIYNVPAITGVDVQPDTVARLAQHPNIVGMKATGTDTAQVAAFVAAGGPRFSVIAGTAPTFYPSLCVGAVGGIVAVACVVPDLAVRLFELATTGQHLEARELQRRITTLAALVTTGAGVPGLKAAMDLAGYVGGEPRPPLRPASPDVVEKIRVEISMLGSLALSAH